MTGTKLLVNTEDDKAPQCVERSQQRRYQRLIRSVSPWYKRGEPCKHLHIEAVVHQLVVRLEERREDAASSTLRSRVS
jgi:hypothetical protein